MIFTGRTMMMSQYSMDKAIARLKDCGFEGLEMSFLDRNFKFRPDMTEPFFAEHTVETARKLRMPIYSTSLHGNFVYDDDKYEAVKQTIQATPFYGTKVCIISNAKKTFEDKRDWETLIERTKVLVEMAEKADVTIAMEFEPGMICGSTEELHRLFEAIGSSRLMANLDIGHVFLCDPNPMEAIASLKGKIAHCHVENMERGVHRHLVPYMGDMDLQEYLVAMQKVGFDGAAALDIYEGDYEQQGRASVAYLKELAASVKC